MSAITIETTYTAARDQRKVLLDGLCSEWDVATSAPSSRRAMR